MPSKRGKDDRTWISIIPSLDEVKETVAPVAKAKPVVAAPVVPPVVSSEEE
ncbi:MAG: hypothetical protein IPO48_17885 [Saprospiraceae bacterium]|nr:hypothetical protein [Saprospiraceae bacterium]